MTQNQPTSNILESAFQTIINSALEKALSTANLAELVKQEIQKLPPYNINIKVNGKLKHEYSGYVRKELEKVLTLANQRINILLVGAAGCGKTHLAKQLAEIMKLKYGSISCSAGLSENHLSGWMLPIQENGRFSYVPSVFVDIYENGGVFLFDELDAADSNTLLFINQALANDGFFIPMRHENPFVKKHKDCIIIAAANTYGQGADLIYSGREKLDESTLDRFRAGIVQIGYDSNLEGKLLCNELLIWAEGVRDVIDKLKLRRVLSTRFLLDAQKLMNCGSSLLDIETIYLQSFSSDESLKFLKELDSYKDATKVKKNLMVSETAIKFVRSNERVKVTVNEDDIPF